MQTLGTAVALEIAGLVRLTPALGTQLSRRSLTTLRGVKSRSKVRVIVVFHTPCSGENTDVIAVTVEGDTRQCATGRCRCTVAQGPMATQFGFVAEIMLLGDMLSPE